MKTIFKIIAVLLLVLFLVSTIAGSVLADPDSISLGSKWTDNISTKLSVLAGEDAELYTSISSNSDLKSPVTLSIKVYDGADKVKTVLDNMTVFADINNPYFNTFKIDTADLGVFGGKDYNVIVTATNTKTAQSTEELLTLNVKKKYVASPAPGTGLSDNDNAPSIDSIYGEKEITEGQQLELDVHGSDPDGDVINYDDAEVCTLHFYGCLFYSPISSIGATFETKDTTYGESSYGKFIWTPDYDFVSHPSTEKNILLRFRANDGDKQSKWKSLVIKVNDKNRVPYFDKIGDKVVNEGQTLNIDLKGHDLDNDNLHYSYVAYDKYGNMVTDAVIIGNAKTLDKNDAIFSWHFDEGSAQKGPYKVTIWVQDGFEGYRSQTFEITVNSTQKSIIARDIEASVNEDSKVDLDMFCSGGEGNLTYSIPEGPAHGELSDVDGNKVTYTPLADYNGKDKFGYICTDSVGTKSNMGTAIITVNPVNDAPVAVDDYAKTDVNVPKDIHVLKNDYDVDNDLINLNKITSQPSNGSVVINSEKPFITYTPNPGFVGTDSFEYEINDVYGDKDTATVTVEVFGAENNALVAVDDYAETTKNTAVTIDILSNDHDSDSELFSLKDNISTPAHGTVMIDDEETTVTYTPDQDFVGEDSFTYTIYDPKGNEDSALVTVNVKDTVQENHAPVANDDEVSTEKNTEIYIDVLNNDTDADNDTLTITSLTAPPHGGIDKAGDQVYYIPDTDFVGDDSFTYTISDGNGGEDTANIIVHVTDNQEPVYQCNDGIDNDHDGFVDYPADPGCDNPQDNDEFNTVVEEPKVPYTNIKFTSALVTQEGDYAYLNAYLLNNGDKDMKDLRVTAMIYSLSARGTGSTFNLDRDENTDANVYIPLPYHVMPGYYLVKVTVQNTQYHDSVYRLVYLS